MVKESRTSSLKSEQKVLLHRSIAQYLDRSGFSKSFKKLISEAEIEKKELNGTTLPDLEEIYCEFLNKSQLEAVELKDESGDDEKANDKKKKKKKKKEANVDENASDDKETVEKDKKKEASVNTVEGVEKVKKEKKKKKKEPKLEVTEEEEKVKETLAEMEEVHKEEKKKKKKNKSKSSEAEPVGDEKTSKKRKRSEPEETKEQAEEDDEASKRMKKEDNVEEEDDMGVQETPVKQTDVQENGNMAKSERKSTNQKSGKGLSNSKEPKKPFQRVNVEDIVFTDDRLRDNSYWAKDGADSGYGAKAQEVLGQVRGRGFRHEKTKKKRGSYRGGEIDLESHSVKFDYSDEE